MSEKRTITGFKAFEPDWTCRICTHFDTYADFVIREMQYAPNSTFEAKFKPVICRQGFHFCTNLLDVYSYHPIDHIVARVEAIGEIADKRKKKKNLCKDSKQCTNKIKIYDKLTDKEILKYAVNYYVSHTKVFDYDRLPDLDCYIGNPQDYWNFDRRRLINCCKIIFMAQAKGMNVD